MLVDQVYDSKARLKRCRLKTGYSLLLRLFQEPPSTTTTPQGTNISHLGKRKIIFKYALSGGYVNSLEGIQYAINKKHSFSAIEIDPPLLQPFCKFGIFDLPKMPRMPSVKR